MKSKLIVLILCAFTFTACGLKVINPNDQNQNAGTLQLDTSSGSVKFVATYTCKLNSSGKRHSALGKTEEEARKEVLAKCKDHTVVSFCKEENITCEKN
jgi:hypothetical protein